MTEVLGLSLLGIRLEFLLFAATLLGVALFHHHTMRVALVGVTTIVAYRLFQGDLDLVAHLRHEAPILLNLFGLLLGFALLATHFSASGVPDVLPRYLPNDWKGGFVLLVMVFVLSSFLDNIAAAMIGGTIALVVFRQKVHVGYLAAIVAASNAGGSGSVVGDTTTTMIWLEGHSPLLVLHAYVAAAVALVVCGVFAARQQHRHRPIVADVKEGARIDWPSVFVVALILAGAILANVYLEFPAAGVWAALLLAAPLRPPAWRHLPGAFKGAVFLLSLVLAASLMPVDDLPAASWQTAFGLGFVSAVFDNIPLTKLALDQGGYDWGVLAYAVGFGGSMVWFGSSAGVALANIFPEAKSTVSWVRHGWHVAVAYVIGFFALLWTVGWHPE